MSYELRIAYSADTTLGDGDVRSRHDRFGDAVDAFLTCSAPFKQLLYLDADDEPDFLDAHEQGAIEHGAEARGLEVGEIDGDDA